MPYAKKKCPTCNGIMDGRSAQCRKCKPSYKRTEKHRQFSSFLWKGKPKNYPTGGSLPGVAEKIRSAWTKKMRKLAQQRGLRNAKNPEWRLRCGLPREKNPMWEDGRSVIPYARGWTRTVKAVAW